MFPSYRRQLEKNRLNRQKSGPAEGEDSHDARLPQEAGQRRGAVGDFFARGRRRCQFHDVQGTRRANEPEIWPRLLEDHINLRIREEPRVAERLRACRQQEPRREKWSVGQRIGRGEQNGRAFSLPAAKRRRQSVRRHFRRGAEGSKSLAQAAFPVKQAAAKASDANAAMSQTGINSAMHLWHPKIAASRSAADLLPDGLNVEIKSRRHSWRPFSAASTIARFCVARSMKR